MCVWDQCVYLFPCQSLMVSGDFFFKVSYNGTHLC